MTLCPTVQIPEAFEGLLEPYRYKVFYGGRGGAKSHTFADVLLMQGAAGRKRVLCAREVQNSIRDSVKRLLDDLGHWTDHGVIFRTRDTFDHPADTDWTKEHNELYAPDVVEKDGKYYLFAYIIGAKGCVDS